MENNAYEIDKTNHLYPYKENLYNYLLKNLLISSNDKLNDLKISYFSYGQSNPTYLLKIKNKKYVLRKKPPGKILSSAHAIEREYHIMKALYPTKVPVPKVYVLCTDLNILDTPFYIMEYIHGRIFKNDITLQQLKPMERWAIYYKMNETLAELHKLDYKTLNLHNFGKIDGKYIERQIKTWSKQYKLSIKSINQSSTLGSNQQDDQLMLQLIEKLNLKYLQLQQQEQKQQKKKKNY